MRSREKREGWQGVGCGCRCGERAGKDSGALAVATRRLARFRERSGAERGYKAQERYAGGWGRAVGLVKGANLERQITKSKHVSRMISIFFFKVSVAVLLALNDDGGSFGNSSKV